jgi:hypothetical protein
VIILAISAAIVGANVPQEKLAAYGTCVAQTAARFKTSDLSGDSAETIITAAEVACRREKLAFVDAIDAFTSERHPDLGPGGRAKITDLFVRMQEQKLEGEISSQLQGKGSN